MKVSFLTLGCKVNQYETEAMKESFASRGYQVVSSEDEAADIYIINTCTVTNLADRKSRQFIRRAKASNPDSVVAVTGCYAQMDSEKVSEIPGVNIVAGTNEKSKLIDYIEVYIGDRMSACHVRAYEELNDYESNGIITAMDSRTRAYIKIQEGCNRFCTYCIIPYARGKVRSRDEGEILKEVGILVDKGFKEIVLTGINTALYGSDSGEFGLRNLLEKIDRLPGDFRVRLSSLEPTVVSKDQVFSILDSERLCNHLHLSIQSGSNKILDSMGRRYDRDEYLEIVQSLRDRNPDYGITTDIIVGFPGEKDEDFADSLDIVRKAKFSKVHVFRYSPRKGTPAATMDDQVPSEEKSRRAKILIEEGEKVSREFLGSTVGKTAMVLLEEKKGNYITGYTDNYTRVYVPEYAKAAGTMGDIKKDSIDTHLNDFIDVKLTEVYKDGMKGERNG